MIPRAQITAWRSQAPWPSDAQVEQDLVLSRALVGMFRSQEISIRLAFRGGTALHKLYITPPGRYSEDIDLVQTTAGPIGPVMDGIRAVLDPWLGKPKRKLGHALVTLTYRFETSTMPVQRMRLKIEINSREHFTVLGFTKLPFRVENRWFSGEADVRCYHLEEMIGTKMRALYQRKKGRDLFDIWTALNKGLVDTGRVIECFEKYLQHLNAKVSRAEFEANLAEKIRDKAFLEDVNPLLPAGLVYDPSEAATIVMGDLVSKLPGEPWKGNIEP